MTTMTISDPTALIGFVAFDADGEKLGEVEGVYLGTDQPEWAAVLLDEQFVIIPLQEAAFYEDSLDIPFTIDEVRGAPLQQPDLLEDLSEDQEDQLVAYYSGGATGEVGGASGATSVRDAGSEVASTAKDHGQEVASTAKEQGQRVASTAKRQGQEVVRSTADQASEVVGTAKQQASEVAQQASEQARNLLEETRIRLEEQTAEGAHKLGDNLSRFGAEAIALADGRPEEAPTLQRYAQRGGESLLDAADRVYGISDDVQTRGIGGLLSDVQTFARRRPGMFLATAFGAGLLAGRLVKNTDTSKLTQSGTDQGPGPYSEYGQYRAGSDLTQAEMELSRGGVPAPMTTGAASAGLPGSPTMPDADPLVTGDPTGVQGGPR